MLTIAKLRSGPGSIDYYLKTVATGIEDYYAGKGEAPGRWIGPAAERLGLNGDIDNTTLNDLMSGRLPGTDTQLGSARKNRTPGWDLTWSAPKSVSILYGLTDPATSAEVVAAHDTAVAEGLRYLDRWGVVSRRSVDGEVRGVETNGMVVAGFRHRTSRNMDPQLHTHAIVANAVERADGTWGAIDSRVFYRHAKTAGYLYQAVLRSELTRRLGVEWGPIANGHAEATAVPAKVNELFSSRRQEIEAELDARGATSARAAQVAAHRSRTAKTHVAGTDVLRTTWRQHVTDADLHVADLDRNLRRSDLEPLTTVSRRQRRLVNDELMGANGLTESRPSFNRADIVRAWCERIDPRTIDVDTDLVDELVASTLTDQRRVLLGNGDPLHGVADPRRWSTTELVTLEHHIVDQVIDGRSTNTATVDPRVANETIAEHPSLSVEQAHMIEAITAGGHRIDAVIGVAGSGKTYALGVANTIWTEHGYRPIGVAYAGKTARGLQAGSGIQSQTIDRLLTQLDRPDHPGLPENSIIVVDEAGMVPTRKLAKLLDHARPDTKVVLVGDHHQLPEIGAGGVLRGIVARVADLPTLTENRRQHHEPEREALAELRDGDVGTGLDWYITSGQVTPCDDMDTARRQLLDTWWTDHTNGRTDQLMMAERRVDVARLNHLARQHFAAHGRLGEQRLHAADHDYAIGDRIMFTHNDDHIGVRNGERGTITALHHRTRSLTVDLDDQPDYPSVDVPAAYLDRGDLVWGYAATVHKNQGATCDHSYLLATDALYRELGYTALSRGRIDNRMWTVTIDIDTDLETAHTPDTSARPDPIIEIRRALQRSAAQQLAIDEAADLAPPEGAPHAVIARPADELELS